jgi:signal transduction histidine kinase
MDVDAEVPAVDGVLVRVAHAVLVAVLWTGNEGCADIWRQWAQCERDVRRFANACKDADLVPVPLQRKLAGKDDQIPGLESHLRDLNLETQRLVDLLSEFRQLAQTQYTFESVALNELITEVLSVPAWSSGESEIRIERDVPDDLPSIEADRRKLKQALINLCKNGVEAMAGGGLLKIRASELDGQLVLEVTDTGPGLPEGLDVFEPFITTKEHGTGLGLSVVRQIVVAHGGTVGYDSRLGVGTTFRLVLPIRQ